MAPSNGKKDEEVYADIENVSKMPQEEFKRQIQDWMETQQPKLQSNLRKDLIENFTKTSLGRQISSSMQNRQGIVLSPLTLVLNTLVSEFLHSQDYHFTLCVFATEVVFPHTLPDFSKENFSFTDKELDEIFEAMGLLHLDSIDAHIGAAYYQLPQEKGHRSLLYAVIKGLIDHLRQIKEEKLNKQVQAPTSTSSFAQVPKANHPPGPKKPPRHNPAHQSSSDSGPEVPININNLKVLNKTIEKLSKSVKNMARHYMHMESSRLNNKSQSHHTSKLELDREEKHYYNLMRHIENISQKLDKCVVNFESLEHRLSTQKVGIDGLDKMRYRDWLEMMSNTKNGKKYIDKFQRSIQRYWEAEKAKLKHYYQEKLSVEKKALKLKYREELREEIESKLGAPKTATDINKDSIQAILENKMQTIETRDHHLGKKLDKLEEIVHEYKDDEQKKKDEIRKMAQKLTETLKTVEKTVQQVPESIICLEKRYTGQNMENEVENIIKSAKCRIKKLEQEGESLEKSFLNYLQRQKDKKKTIETDRIRIWQDYQLERRALQSHPANMPRTSTPFDVVTVVVSSDKGGLNYDDMASDLNNTGITAGHRGHSLNVVNPFKTFNTATYLQKAHERRLLEGPKIERLEAYRRLDREVENIKRKVFMDHGFKSGVSNMYLNPRGGSIFGTSRYMNEEKTEVKEKEIQTDLRQEENGTLIVRDVNADPPVPSNKEVKWHGILKPTESRSYPTTMPYVKPSIPSTIPTIFVQGVSNHLEVQRPVPAQTKSSPENTTLKPPLNDINPSSDRSSPLKSDFDLGEVTLDIELSKTTKSSSGNSSNEKPIPDIGLNSPLEKGANDAKEKETWREELLRGTNMYNRQETNEIIYKSLLIPAVKVVVEGKGNEIDGNHSIGDDEKDDPDKTIQTVKDMSSKFFDGQSPEQKSSTFETEIERMAKKADELHDQLNKGLHELLQEPKPSTSTQFLQVQTNDEKLNKLMVHSSTTSESHLETRRSLDDKHQIPISDLSQTHTSSDSSDHFKISTGKPSSSETSEEFWK